MTFTIGIRGVMTFAAGAALALVAVFAFQPWEANAGSSGNTTFVAITPCRLFDTRPGIDNVGSRNTPLGADETSEFRVAGKNGNCSLPSSGIDAVAMNVTAVGPTAASFLTIWPADDNRPGVSTLNYVPGGAPTPNKVDVKLSSGGNIKLYNLAGSADVIGDVVGYYTTDLADLVEFYAHRVDEILSGTAKVDPGSTYTGHTRWDHTIVANGEDIAVSVEMPIKAWNDLIMSDVNMAVTGSITIDGDPACTGTYANPTAPTGKVCVYLGSWSNIGSISAGGSGLDDVFTIIFTASGNPGEDIYARFAWAYHAPSIG